MAVSSTAFNACNAKIYLDNSAGTYVDVSGYANKIDLELSQEIGEFDVFGTSYKQRIRGCKKDGKASMEVVMDKDTNGAFRLLKDWYQNGSGARRIQVSAPDEAVGDDRWWGYFLLKSLSWSFSATEANAVMVKAELVPSGGILYETVTT